MKFFLSLILCLPLAFLSIVRAADPTKKPNHPAKIAEKKAGGEKADAKALLADANKALALLIKAARTDDGLDVKTAKNKPFWISAQTIAKSLKQANKGLAEKNDDFFKGIAEARRAEAQLKIDWQLTDSKNKEVIENGKKLGHAIALLRTQYSREAARKKKGGELTEKEKASLVKIKAQQKDLLSKLKKLEKESKNDKALAKGLQRIQAQAKHVLKEPDTLEAYLATLYLLDEQFGLIRGYGYYVDKPWRADYLILLNDVPTYDVVYTSEETVTYDWVQTELAVDIYEGEDVDVSNSLSEEEVASEEDFAADENVDMSADEQDEVAADEDMDEEVAADDDSMDDASDDEGSDMSGDDEGGGDEGADDGGGDEGGE